MLAGDGAPRSFGTASASKVTLQLTDLSYSAYALNPQGGSAAVSSSRSVPRGGLRDRYARTETRRKYAGLRRLDVSDRKYGLDAGLTASRDIPPIPEPSVSAMVLAGLL